MNAEQYTKSTIKVPYVQKDVVIYKRKCGHDVIFAYKKGEAVNISTWIKTGSINENDENNGVSHFLEHLMFKGTHKLKAGQFDKILESKGAIVNAATWKDYTFYHVTLPKGKNNENFYEALDLHADMMMNPVIPPEEIGEEFDVKNPPVNIAKRERHVVIEEIRMRDDLPWTKVYNATNERMYKNHPYKREVIGTPEIIASMPRQTVLNYYNEFYTPENMTTVVVGDFNFDEIFDKICDLFDFSGRNNISHKKHIPEFCITKPVYNEIYADVRTGFLTIGYLCPEAKNYKDGIIADIINIILGEGQSSRLYRHLIEENEDGMFNIAVSDFYQFRDGGNFFIEANFKPEYKEKALSLIKDEINALLNENVSEEELKKAVKKLKVRFAQNSETVSDISETIGFYMTVCDGLEGITEFEKNVNSVTSDDIRKFANKYLTADKSVTSVLMPERR